MTKIFNLCYRTTFTFCFFLFACCDRQDFQALRNYHFCSDLPSHTSFSGLEFISRLQGCQKHSDAYGIFLQDLVFSRLNSAQLKRLQPTARREFDMHLNKIIHVHGHVAKVYKAGSFSKMILVKSSNIFNDKEHYFTY